jgi:hypothetical protein
MTDSGKPCIFPFISAFSAFSDRTTYDECPVDVNKVSCPTELNSKGEMVKSKSCGPGCPWQEPKRRECQIKTIQVLKQGSRFIAYYGSDMRECLFQSQIGLGSAVEFFL